MSIGYSKKSHAGAWQRITADDRPAVPVKNPLAQALQQVEAARVAYEETLNDMFSGRCASAAVLYARVRWCQAQSHVVDLRLRNGKAYGHV